jgi:hypothetical protein
LDTVLEELASLQATLQETRHIEASDKNQILAAFERLEIMLKNRDPECMVFLDTIRAIPGTQQLVSQVENFDFKPAIVTIAALREQLPAVTL